MYKREGIYGVCKFTSSFSSVIYGKSLQDMLLGIFGRGLSTGASSFPFRLSSLGGGKGGGSSSSELDVSISAMLFKSIMFSELQFYNKTNYHCSVNKQLNNGITELTIGGTCKNLIW